MSQLHYIKTVQQFDFDLLQRVVEQSLDNVAYEQRAENLCYFWVDGSSTRGVDITLEEENLIEIRNTSLSNLADYRLTNQLAESICNLFAGTLLGENPDYDDDASIPKLIQIERPLYPDEYYEQTRVHDATLVRTMILTMLETISIYGPVRKVHFGKRIMGAWKDDQGEDLANKMEALIIKVNYELPHYSYGNIMETGEGENTKTLKLITNEVDCIIYKYDYVMFNKNQQLIIINNDTLNTLLPTQWQLVDEYTVVAPILPTTHFEDLVDRAKKVNQIVELMKDKG